MGRRLQLLDPNLDPKDNLFLAAQAAERMGQMNGTSPYGTYARPGVYNDLVAAAMAADAANTQSRTAGDVERQKLQTMGQEAQAQRDFQRQLKKDEMLADFDKMTMEFNMQPTPDEELERKRYELGYSNPAATPEDKKALDERWAAVMRNRVARVQGVIGQGRARVTGEPLPTMGQGGGQPGGPGTTQPGMPAPLPPVPDVNARVRAERKEALDSPEGIVGDAMTRQGREGKWFFTVGGDRQALISDPKIQQWVIEATKQRPQGLGLSDEEVAKRLTDTFIKYSQENHPVATWETDWTDTTKYIRRKVSEIRKANLFTPAQAPVGVQGGANLGG